MHDEDDAGGHTIGRGNHRRFGDRPAAEPAAADALMARFVAAGVGGAVTRLLPGNGTETLMGSCGSVFDRMAAKVAGAGR